MSDRSAVPGDAAKTDVSPEGMRTARRPFVEPQLSDLGDVARLTQGDPDSSDPFGGSGGFFGSFSP